MSFEAMDTLAAAEEQVRQMLADAGAEAKQSLARAREEGEQMIADALRKADSELTELGKQADEKVKSDVLALADNNENRKAAMRAHAEARADAAAAFVVERIVNG